MTLSAFSELGESLLGELVVRQVQGIRLDKQMQLQQLRYIVEVVNHNLNVSSTEAGLYTS